jgi:hypothetical protein
MKERMATLRNRVGHTLIASAIAMTGGCTAFAQSVREPALKAAFLYNFAKFTEWPADALPAGVPLALCVVGDRAVAQSLQQAVTGKRIGGHPLVMQQIDADGPVRTCHLIYAGDINTRTALQLLDATKGQAVLTVSDLDRFAQIGGTAQLFFEGERMRFAVNVDAAQRGRLRLSSQLLALARIVKDDPDDLAR